MWCVTATQLMWLQNWIVYFLSATLSSFISENWQWRFVLVMRDTRVWISYTYFRMYEDFKRWFFESKCYTFLFIHFTPANRAYRTHKMLMVMIWLHSLSLALRMKVLFTCLDLRVLSLTAVAVFHFTYSRAGRVTWIRRCFAQCALL